MLSCCFLDLGRCRGYCHRTELDLFPFLFAYNGHLEISSKLTSHLCIKIFINMRIKTLVHEVDSEKLFYHFTGFSHVDHLGCSPHSPHRGPAPSHHPRDGQILLPHALQLLHGRSSYDVNKCCENRTEEEKRLKIRS